MARDTQAERLALLAFTKARGWWEFECGVHVFDDDPDAGQLIATPNRLTVGVIGEPAGAWGESLIEVVEEARRQRWALIGIRPVGPYKNPSPPFTNSEQQVVWITFAPLGGAHPAAEKLSDELVREIVRAGLDGVSTYKIASDLTAREVPTPGGAKDKPWHHEQVRRILKSGHAVRLRITEQAARGELADQNDKTNQKGKEVNTKCQLSI